MKLTIEKHQGAAPAGLAAWLLARWRGRTRTVPRMALLERITLAPRQTLCLVEAEGRRFLVASSAEGSPAFYPLDSKAERPRSQRRVSW